ncbi:hypothetical protein BGZ82_000344 [Podila clonocystis]|nr:hypothetical protein BGZ82_000344 [Podila clonocystis]
MNILQHKSWHVYNQKNRDKVRKDEANAEAEQKKVEDRAIAADREHRLAVLRQRAQRRLGNSGDDSNDSQGDRSHGIPTAEDTVAVVTTSISPSKQEHVNFWADLEKQDTKSSAGNPEREEEAKSKQEKWDRTIAMHLDTGIKGKSPWYLSPHAGSMETSAKRGDDKEFTKAREDPLQAMKSQKE